MARPKSYDRDEAIRRACVAFWEQGYQALGVRELEALSGINQFAIQTEFGGKEGLYLETLKFYSDAAISTAMQPLIKGAIPEIIIFLQNLTTAGSMTSSSAGCLIVNTGIENARIGSPRLDQAVQHYWQSLEHHFHVALRNARNAGDIPAGLDIEALARGLVAAVMGVHAKNRTAGAHDAGQDLVDLVCIYLNALRIS